MTARDINNTNTRLKAFRDDPRLHSIRPTSVSAARLDNFVAPNKSITCHANLQIVLETFSHAQPASKYSLSNGAETALTKVHIILLVMWRPSSRGADKILSVASKSSTEPPLVERVQRT
ncbi:hypothetical protein C770_GR4pD0910 (plasmid) [Sinorhizobium meliloti GR4]|nr:hypothetical protein C770_GR4pD0910 [Sinorhizobium meliloti GR4]